VTGKEKAELMLTKKEYDLESVDDEGWRMDGHFGTRKIESYRRRFQKEKLGAEVGNCVKGSRIRKPVSLRCQRGRYRSDYEQRRVRNVVVVHIYIM